MKLCSAVYINIQAYAYRNVYVQSANKLQWECWCSFVLRSELAKVSTCFATLIVLLEDCIFMIPSQVLSFTMNLDLNNKPVFF